MVTDFSQPQRQSPIGVLVMFFDTIRIYARALWPILLVWIFKFKELNTIYLVAGIVAIFTIIAFIAYLRYRNFTFFLDVENQEFILTEGIFNKTRTSIQLNKIQQVNIKQSLIQKIISVYAVDVDTAGSNKQEVGIKAVSHEVALELKARLLESDASVNAAPESQQEQAFSTEKQEHPFVKVGFLSLIKVGLTSNYVKSFLLLLAFFFSTYENLRHVIDDTAINEQQIDDYFAGKMFLEIIPLIVLGLFIVILIMNVGRMIFVYFNFSVTRQNGSLLLSYGLLNTKSTIIKPERVQITTITRNYFQKKLDILQIKIRQATSGEKQEKNSAIEIPGCSAYERDEILKLIFQQLPEKGVMLRPDFRKLGFAVFLTIVLPLLGFYAIKYYSGTGNSSIDYFVPIYVAVLSLLQYFKYRNYRLFIHNDFIVKQNGAWDISNEIIKPGKIQAITTSQLFWHKSLNIGSLTLHTAGGDIQFQLGDFEKIRGYVNLWLYEMEVSDSNWM